MPIRLKLWVLALVLFALVSTGRGLWQRWQRFDGAAVRQDADLAVAKFAALRQELAASPTEVLDYEWAGESQPELFRKLIRDHAKVAVYYLANGSMPVPMPPGVEASKVIMVSAEVKRRQPDSREQDAELCQKGFEILRNVELLQHRRATVRYALVPHLRNVTQIGSLVVGDFPAGFDYQALAKEKGLQVVKDFGNGAVLFRKP